MLSKRWRENKMLSARIPDRRLPYVEQFARLAQEDDRSMSEMIMLAIVEYVEKVQSEGARLEASVRAD